MYRQVIRKGHSLERPETPFVPVENSGKQRTLRRCEMHSRNATRDSQGFSTVDQNTGLGGWSYFIEQLYKRGTNIVRKRSDKRKKARTVSFLEATGNNMRVPEDSMEMIQTLSQRSGDAPAGFWCVTRRECSTEARMDPRDCHLACGF